jgi:hypothetical protein
MAPGQLFQRQNGDEVFSISWARMVGFAFGYRLLLVVTWLASRTVLITSLHTGWNTQRFWPWIQRHGWLMLAVLTCQIWSGILREFQCFLYVRYVQARTDRPLSVINLRRVKWLWKWVWRLNLTFLNKADETHSITFGMPCWHDLKVWFISIGK